MVDFIIKVLDSMESESLHPSAKLDFAENILDYFIKDILEAFVILGQENKNLQVKFIEELPHSIATRLLGAFHGLGKKHFIYQDKDDKWHWEAL